MDLATNVQILHGALYISHNANSFVKCMDPTTLFSALGKW